MMGDSGTSCPVAWEGRRAGSRSSRESFLEEAGFELGLKEKNLNRQEEGRAEDWEVEQKVLGEDSED